MTKSLYFIAFLLLSCKKHAPSDFIEPILEDQFVVYSYSMDNLETANEFYHDSLTGDTLRVSLLTEASGLAVSRSNPSFFWSHNDSGHPNWLFPVPANGVNHGYVTLSAAGARDWEDICIGPGPIEGINYIYVADIGDNGSNHDFVVIYRVPEPDLTNFNPNQTLAIDMADVERFEFQYPDGPVDSETLMIDPWNGDLYIVTKREYRSILYRAKAPLNSSERSNLEKLAQFPFNWAVAGDISADGKHIAIKTLFKIYYWKRAEGQTIVNALAVKPKLLPYILEPQGESFGWLPDASGYFTLSEKSGIYPPIIYFYTKN